MNALLLAYAAAWWQAHGAAAADAARQLANHDTKDAPMTINTDLLDEVLAHIEANPATWRQGAWRCATGMCFAGWTVQLTGGEWAADPTDDLCDLSDAVIADADDPAEDISWMPDGHTQVVAAFLRARRKLGLGKPQAAELFAGSNTLEDLRHIVARLKATAAIVADLEATATLEGER